MHLRTELRSSRPKFHNAQKDSKNATIVRVKCDSETQVARFAVVFKEIVT